MATTAGFPLSLHQDVDLPILLLSDSEDDSVLSTPPRNQGNHALEPPPRSNRRKESDEEAMRQKTDDAVPAAPLHPIPAMQLAFAESLVEATTNAAALKPKLRFGTAKERRQRLLDGPKGAKLHGELWRYRPDQSHHELWKLMAQVSFGVYLLLNGIANSNIQVVNILQGHIDEVDEFLETTMEDVNLAIEDVKERIDFLKLPMDNIGTFEKMLEDRAFRLQIVTGNEKIEHIVSRTATALEASLKDVDEGMKATKEFAVYLGDQQNRPWRQQRPDVIDIFDAMKGNAEGWYKAFVDLQGNASTLDGLLIKLGQMVAEMDRRAGEVSRRTRVSPASAYELNLRASALMPLQFSVAPFSEPHSPSAGSSRVGSLQSSQRSSQRSSTSNPPSDVKSLPHSSGRFSGRSPSWKSPPTSPSARSTIPEFHYLRPQSHESAQSVQTRNPAPMKESVHEDLVEEDEGEEDYDDDGDKDEDSEPEAEHEAQPELRIDTSRTGPIDDEGLYILQPRTYTPLPPEPLPSPMIRDVMSHPDLRDAAAATSAANRTSLRQRLSLKGNNPPDSIQVPARNERRIRILSSRGAPDSAYGSDGDARLNGTPAVDPFADLSPPEMANSHVPSPFSDQHYFRPVQASPHSPLQQRPWTSGNAGNSIQRPHTSATHRVHSGYQRDQPSAMGMSMLSNVDTVGPDGKTLKKKKSTFGWLKKAFALDEEERAAFEARKQLQAPNPYNDARSPKFLDGKRRDDYRRQ